MTTTPDTAIQPLGWHIANNNGRLTCNQKLIKTSLIYCMEPKKWISSKEMVNSQESVKSVWKRTWEGFVEEVGFESGVKEWRSYGWWEWRIYGESQSDRHRKIWVRDGETVTRLSERAKEFIPEMKWGITKRPIVIGKDDNEGGRERVTTDEEWMLQWRWTVIRWCRYEGLAVVRTLYVRDRILYSMNSVILSQWRECKWGTSI